MQSKEKDNLIFVRLFPNEDIFESLEKVCKKHEIKTALILSGIGQLKKFQLGYFKKKGNYSLEKFKKPHELLSLSGNIIFSEKEEKYKFHLHAVLGNKEKHSIGGHLLKGKVEVTNEIVLLKTNLQIRRKLEKETGLEGMILE
jgi:hypothetical protein